MRLDSHSAGVFDLAIDPSGQYVACALEEAPMRVYRISDGSEVLSLRDRNSHSARAVAWYTRDHATYIVVGYADAGYLRIVDLDGKDYIRFGRKSSDYGYPNAAQLNADSIAALLTIGHEVHTAGADGVSTRLTLDWDDEGYVTYSRKLEKKTRTGGVTSDLLLWGDDTILFAVNSPPQSSLPSYEVRRHTLATMRERAGRRLAAHERDIVSLKRVSDTCFATLSRDTYLRVWHYETWELVAELQIGDPDLGTPQAMTTHDDLILLGVGHMIFAYDSTTLERVDTLTYHSCPVQALAASRKARVLVSGDSEGGICIEPFRSS